MRTLQLHVLTIDMMLLREAVSLILEIQLQNIIEQGSEGIFIFLQDFVTWSLKIQHKFQRKPCVNQTKVSDKLFKYSF